MRLQLVLCDMLMLPAETLAADSPHEIVMSDLSASLHVEPLPLRDQVADARFQLVGRKRFGQIGISAFVESFELTLG